MASCAVTSKRPTSERSSVVFPAPSGPTTPTISRHSRTRSTGPRALDIGDRDVDLHVLVFGVDDRDDRGPRLRELAGPDVLRLHDGRHRRRVNLVFRMLDLDLAELRLRELALAPQHLEIARGH